MPLCQTCLSITIDDIINTLTLFHSTLHAWKASVEQGCEFCLLTWSVFGHPDISALDQLLENELAALHDGTEEALRINLIAYNLGVNCNPTINIYYGQEGCQASSSIRYGVLDIYE